MNATASQRKMMGLDHPSDQKVMVRVGDWGVLKLAIWRSKVGWAIAARAAVEIVGRCQHVDGCPGAANEMEPCLPGCPDREQRMSALVVLNATRILAPIDARQPSNEPYMAPSREHYAEIIAELAAAQAELDAWREKYGSVEPSPNERPELPPPAKYDHQLEEAETEEEEEST